jgi:hypothetical protein
MAALAKFNWSDTLPQLCFVLIVHREKLLGKFSDPSVLKSLNGIRAKANEVNVWMRYFLES